MSPQSHHPSIASYLNIGGKVWIFGRDCLTVNDDIPRFRIVRPTVHPAGQFASFYFDVEDIYVPVWFEESVDRVNNSFIPGNDDFIGAIPTDPMVGVLPEIWVDTSRTSQYFIPGAIRGPLGFNIGDFTFETIPETNFLVLGVNAEALYLYQSRYAGTAFPHDKVVAARYIGPSRFNPIFKTAWFGTSPYGFEYEPLVEVFEKMIEWFDEPMP